MDTTTLLQKACTQKTPVVLVSMSQESRIPGKFEAIEDGILKFTVANAESFNVLGMVSVTFQIEAATHTFLSAVMDTEGTQLWLSMPRQLVSTDARRIPRTPVTAPIEVEVMGAHYSARARLMDIATTGMKIEFSSNPRITPGERLPVILSWEEHRIEIVAELRHQSGNTCGFFFPQSIKRGVVDPPRDLARLIKAIEKWAHPPTEAMAPQP